MTRGTNGDALSPVSPIDKFETWDFVFLCIFIFLCGGCIFICGAMLMFLWRFAEQAKSPGDKCIDVKHTPEEAENNFKDRASGGDELVIYTKTGACYHAIHCEHVQDRLVKICSVQRAAKLNLRRCKMFLSGHAGWK
ncbi:unnamed protein product [Effrenium voratum]|nr:unnamed protein product [Effrenium voratum]